MEAIEINHIEAELQKFDPIEAAIAGYREQYLPLKINGIEDKAGYKAVHDARMIIKNKRVAVDKMRKAMNENAQASIKAVNSKAKDIEALLEPIESHLEEQEFKGDAEKAWLVKQAAEADERARKEAEEKEIQRLQSRITQLQQYGFVADYFAVREWSDEQFETQLEHARIDYEKEIEAKAEAARLAEAETKRLADERAELDRMRKEQEEREAAMKAEQDRIAAEQEAREKKVRDAEEAIARQQREAEEQARRDTEEATRIENEQKRLKEVAENARLKAIEDVRLESERLAKEEADRKAETARQEALRPDKEKLLDLSNRIVAITLPVLESPEANTILKEAQELLNKVQFHIVKRAKSL